MREQDQPREDAGDRPRPRERGLRCPEVEAAVAGCHACVASDSETQLSPRGAAPLLKSDTKGQLMVSQSIHSV